VDFLPFGKAEEKTPWAGEELGAVFQVSKCKASRSKLRGCVNRPDARTAVIRELLKILLQRAISPLRILESLLNRGKILLRRRHISSFQVPLQLTECLRDRITASSHTGSSRTGRARGCAGVEMASCVPVALDRSVLDPDSRLQILPQLLKLLLKLFEFRW
jgi:hypothetical protein